MPNQVQPMPDVRASHTPPRRATGAAADFDLLQHQRARHQQMTDPTVRFALETLVEQIEESGQRFYDALMAVDKSGDGTLSLEELDAGLQGIEVHLSKDSLSAVLNVCDEDGGGTVDMNEFIAVIAAFRSEMRQIGTVELLKRMIAKNNPFRTRRHRRRRRSKKIRTFMLDAQGPGRVMYPALIHPPCPFSPCPCVCVHACWFKCMRTQPFAFANVHAHARTHARTHLILVLVLVLLFLFLSSSLFLF